MNLLKNNYQVILEVANHVAAVRQPAALLQVILEKLKPIFGFDDACIFILDKEKKHYHNWNVVHPPEQNSFPPSFNYQDLHGSEELSRIYSFLEQTLQEIQKANRAVWIDWQQDSSQYNDVHMVSEIFQNDFQRSLAFHLKICGDTLGCFFIHFLNKISLQDATIQLFQHLTNQISIALANIFANQDILEREQEKSTQLAILEVFNQPLSWEERFLKIAQILDNLLKCDLFSYSIRLNDGRYIGTGYLKNPADEKFQVNSFEQYLQDLNLSEAEYRKLYDAATEFFTGNKFYGGEVLEAAKHEYELLRISANAYNKQSLMFSTQYFGKGSVLFILDARANNSYNEKKLQFLVSISQQMTLAIVNILAHEEITQLNHRLTDENQYLREEVKGTYNYGEIIGQHHTLREIMHHIGLVASVDSSVLVMGETGTGKELIARAIHNQSPRSKKPLIKVNCAALPEALFESELFGHEKGAFTGAIQTRIGKFELAQDSTLFLDEVGELPLDLQAKLLRVLQEKEIERVGANKPIKINVRIIAATNRNLEKEVAEGKFRADLFYRLNVFPLLLPPLRERKEDIPLLVEHILEKLEKRLGKDLKGVSNAVMKKLTDYSWHGNIRELEHVLERAAILSPTSLIREVFLPQMPTPAKSKQDTLKSLQEHEKETILKALQKSKGRIRGKEGAAEILHIKPTTLEARMKKLGIVRELFYRTQ